MMEGVSYDNPKGFLVIGGALLLLLGIIGFIIPGLLGELLWFDFNETIAHTVLGIVGLAAAYTFPATYQRWLVGALAVLGLFVGIYGFFLGTGSLAQPQVLNFFGLANFENPLENLVHVVVGLWAAYVFYRSGQSTMMMAK